MISPNKEALMFPLFTLLNRYHYWLNRTQRGKIHATEIRRMMIIHSFQILFLIRFIHNRHRDLLIHSKSPFTGPLSCESIKQCPHPPPRTSVCVCTACVVVHRSPALRPTVPSVPSSHSSPLLARPFSDSITSYRIGRLWRRPTNTQWMNEWMNKPMNEYEWHNK